MKIEGWHGNNYVSFILNGITMATDAWPDIERVAKRRGERVIVVPYSFWITFTTSRKPVPKEKWYELQHLLITGEARYA